MPSLRVAPYRRIATDVAARVAAARDGRDPLAPWDEEVLVPSRGAAEAIATELLAHLPHGVAGLRLQSLDELATRIITRNGETPRVASEAERRLAMRLAVRSIDDPIMTSRGIAAMLERSYRDLRDGGFTLADYERRMRRTRRAELVLRAWTEYERRIAHLNAIDPADLLGRAARLVDDGLAPQLLAGFYDMTGVQFQLLQALLRANLVAAIWVPTEAPFAQTFIRAIAPHWVPAERVPGPSSQVPADGDPAESHRKPATDNRQPRDGQPAPTLHVTTYDTRSEELRAVCTRVAEVLADGTPAHEVGIVARALEPYDVRLLHRFAEEHGFRAAMPEETPLAAHRLGRGALTLLRLRERGFPRADVLALVRDGLHTRTHISADVTDATTRRARIAGGTSEELRRMRSRSRVIDDYIALVSELEELTATLDIARLGSLFRIETEIDLVAAEKLDAIAAMCARFGGLKPAAPQDVIDAIENETILRQPPTANRQPPQIWTGEVLRFRGRTFTHLFVVRMQDDVFPQRRTEDPLLPDSDRRHLGLREIGDGREEEQLLFELLADSTSEHVHFSYASGDGFGKVLRPSRFVRGVARDSLLVAGAKRHEQPATRNEQRQLQLLVKSGTRSVFDGYLPPLDPERLRSLSPTQLEDFGECPQKFLFKHLLGVEDVDQPERELQIHHRDKGILDHRILERFYRSMSEREIRAAAATLPWLSNELGARLEQIIDEHFDDHEAVVPPFNRTVRDIERRATKRILRELVIHDLADLDAQQLVPRWFEYRFGTKHRVPADHPDPFVIEAAGVPVRVEGTIDRIDAGEGRFRIVDYKSGKALRHVNLGEKIDRGVRLQLALYAMAVADFFHAEPEQVSGTIKPIVVGDVKPAKFAFALAEKRAGLLETLEIFIGAMLRGHFPAFPNDRDEDFNSCKYCPVNHSCRTKHDVEERYAVQQQKDPRTLLGGGR